MTKEKKYIVKTVTDKKTGKRVYFYGKTQREVNQKMLNYKRKEERGRLFREVSDEWWEEAEKRLSLTSAVAYASAKRKVDEEFGNMPIRAIEPEHLEKYYSRLVAQGYSYGSVMHRKKNLNHVFKKAFKNKEIDTNPCLLAMLPKGLAQTKRSAAKPEEEQKIRGAAKEWLFPYFALLTGMRRGEILALKWGDIDFIKNRIDVCKEIVFVQNNPVLQTRTKTAAGTRIVPLLNDLKKELLSITPRPADEYIFSRDGKPLTSMAFYYRMKKFQEKVGVSCVAHQLRHSFATVAFEKEVPVKSIQEILGHKNISTTLDTYTDFRLAALDAATEMLNK